MADDEKIKNELEKARSSRDKGNEGMARVCARRAAGIAVREYLQSKNIDPPALNNFEILSDEKLLSYLPIEITDHLNHLTMRVDENYNLPPEIDLIYDAEMVIQLMLKES